MHFITVHPMQLVHFTGTTVVVILDAIRAFLGF